MTDEEKSYGLLLAAIVAIVAIVGMVILFSKGMDAGGVTFERNLGQNSGEMNCVANDDRCPGAMYCEWETGSTCSDIVPTFRGGIGSKGQSFIN